MRDKKGNNQLNCTAIKKSHFVGMELGYHNAPAKPLPLIKFCNFYQNCIVLLFLLFRGNFLSADLVLNQYNHPAPTKGHRRDIAAPLLTTFRCTCALMYYPDRNSSKLSTRDHTGIDMTRNRAIL